MSQSPVKVETNGTGTKEREIRKPSISVHSSGEVSSLPDVIQFTVSIQSSKDTVEEAQASVKRRTDYVTQVIRKNGGKNNDITISTDISKRNTGGITQCEADMVTVWTNVTVKCNSVSSCETIRNMLIEKMDSSVQFSPVVFWHSTDAKEVGRREAFKRAVTSAKAKAECISQTVGVQLGAGIEVKETAQDFTLEPLWRLQSKHPDSVPTTHSVSLHQKYMNASITFISHVFICFETQPIRSCNHKKCHKQH